MQLHVKYVCPRNVKWVRHLVCKKQALTRHGAPFQAYGIDAQPFVAVVLPR